MKTYGDLNLKQIREDNGLDFAHFTYLKGQCSCCYGPMDMPARYWHRSKKPVEIRKKTGKNASFHYELDGKPFDMDGMKYILFKNANNGSGTVKKSDTIDDYTCIGYSENLYGEKLEKICRDLARQLDEDYVVIVPKTSMRCIMICVPKTFRPWQNVEEEIAEMRQEKSDSGAVVAWQK